jgi:hypothetical protein
MKYINNDTNNILTFVCVINTIELGGEYTLCGNAIPDTDLDAFGCEASGNEYEGKLKNVTCPNCKRHINFIKGFK